MDDIRNWDEDFIKSEVAPAEETEQLEKKASGKLTLNTKGAIDGPSREELAKQVCAFANSGAGVIVYGIGEDKSLDDGVSARVGRQPLKDHIEALIPQLVTPSLTSCTARTFQFPGTHSADTCLLAVSVPLSERRPHWTIEGTKETAYIRAGAHSSPMRMQSVLDIASRQEASSAEILDFLIVAKSEGRNERTRIKIMPQIRLLNGRMCEHWAFQLDVVSPNINFESGAINGPDGVMISDAKSYYAVRTVPLFPGRISTALHDPLPLFLDTSAEFLDFGGIKMTLFLDSGFSTSVIQMIRR